MSNSRKLQIAAVGLEHMNRAIERYKSELEKDKSWRKPQNGSTFFNGGYVDYLDGNFVPSERKPESESGERTRTKQDNNRFHNMESHGYDYESMVWEMNSAGVLGGGEDG